MDCSIVTQPPALFSQGKHPTSRAVLSPKNSVYLTHLILFECHIKNAKNDTWNKFLDLKPKTLQAHIILPRSDMGWVPPDHNSVSTSVGIKMQNQLFIPNPRTWAESYLATPLHVGMLYLGQCKVCMPVSNLSYMYRSLNVQY